MGTVKKRWMTLFTECVLTHWCLVVPTQRDDFIIQPEKKKKKRKMAKMYELYNTTTECIINISWERTILCFYRFGDSLSTLLLYDWTVYFILHPMKGLWRQYFSFINFLLCYKLMSSCLWSFSRERCISEAAFIIQKDK